MSLLDHSRVAGSDGSSRRLLQGLAEGDDMAVGVDTVGGQITPPIRREWLERRASASSKTLASASMATGLER